MSEETPQEETPQEDAPRYEINSVKDFLEVPKDRLHACLEDFQVYLLMAHGLLEGIKESSHGVSILEGLMDEYPPFTWIDDGKNNANFKLLVKDSDGEECVMDLGAALNEEGVETGLNLVGAMCAAEMAEQKKEEETEKEE
jgi:hypothetical protein